MTLYTNAPGDEYWNTAHPWAVIEADERPHPGAEATMLHVSAPAGFAWPTVYPSSFVPVPDTAGPPRLLDSRDEWLDLYCATTGTTPPYR